MIIFLYGQDTYRSKEELKKIIKAKKNQLDFFRIDCKDDDVFQKIRESIDIVSMFNQGKLIILENIFQAESQEEIMDFLKERDLKNVEIVIWDEEPDKKSKLFKFLESKAKVKEFHLLQGQQLKNWIKEYTIQQGGKIDIQAIDKLTDYAGNNLWRLSNELNKLIAYKIPNTKYRIQVQDIELLVKPEIDLNIFKTIDALAYKDKEKFFKLVTNHLEKGESEGYLMDRFVYQVRNLIKAKSGGRLDMHPFVVQKSREQARKFSFEQLKKIYSQLLTIDFNIKTGRSDFMTELELLVSNL